MFEKMKIEIRFWKEKRDPDPGGGPSAHEILVDPLNCVSICSKKMSNNLSINGQQDQIRINLEHNLNGNDRFHIISCIFRLVQHANDNSTTYAVIGELGYIY